MTIERTIEYDSVVLAVSGELTAVTAEQLNVAIDKAIGETSELTLDFMDLEYVASAGLRMLLKARKAFDVKGGSFTIRNVSEEVMNVFEITGFDNMLEII